MIDTSPVILLCAGGTGGHMFPAKALAQDLITRGFRVVFATDARGLKYVQDLQSDIGVHVLSSDTLRAGIKGKIKGISALALGYAQSHALINQIKPKVVVGFGGYPSLPPLLAAQHRNIPTIVHEQNAVLGQANKFLSAKAAAIATSLPNTKGTDHVHPDRVILTGNPVRAEIARLTTQAYPVIAGDMPLNVLVMGGSLGATVFSDVVPEAFARLEASQRARLQIMQQCREEDRARTEEFYTRANIKAEVRSFFDDVPEKLAKAHLIISRSGASTVAEVTTAGRPAIFVPMQHADRQQTLNAEHVADMGGAWVMPQSGFTPDTLRAKIELFFYNPEMLFRAAEASHKAGKPDAARQLGNLVQEKALGWGK